MKRFFGGLCMVIGFLIATGAGLCSLVYIFDQSRSFYDVLMNYSSALLVSGIPIFVGITLFQYGRSMYPCILDKEEVDKESWNKRINLFLGWMSTIIGVSILIGAGLYGLVFLVSGVNSLSVIFTALLMMGIPILLGVNLYKLGQDMLRPYKGKKDDTR